MIIRPFSSLDVTSAFVSVAGGSGVLVGDMVMPEGGGWQSGQPGVGAFVPYALVELSSSVVSTQSLAWAGEGHSFSWSVTSHGSSVEQVDATAAAIRSRLYEAMRTRPVNTLFAGYRLSAGAYRYDTNDEPWTWVVRDEVSCEVSGFATGGTFNLLASV